MKTKYLVIMFTMVLCIVSLVSCSSNDMEEFSIDEYADYSFYLEVENVGEITNADDAKHVAEKIFDDEFGFDLLNNMKPYVVSYDKKNDAWLVQASSIFGKKLGAHLLVYSNGEIIAYWGQKN